MRDTYTHGHDRAVLSAHRRRTAENSAAYLLAELEADAEVLDVGCGPGTITADLADAVPNGHVVGVDADASVVAAATAESGRENAEFRVGDVYDLGFPDASFDVVHAHQVLQHLSRPVAALTEMARVLRPSGILAVRDCDYGAFTWSPENPDLARWLDVYRAVARRNGAEPDAGRHLTTWVRRAGLAIRRVTGSVWVFADAPDRAWWGETWAERTTSSALARQAVAYGVATEDELTALAAAWTRWRDDPDGFFAVPHIEVLATR